MMNVKGFDCNTKLSYNTAVKFKKDGWGFAVRYVAREKMDPEIDIDKAEKNNIITAGLGLMLVQHCPGKNGIHPSKELGQHWGENAREFAKEVEYEQDCILYVDLENVNPAYKEKQTLIYDYVNYWTEEVYKFYTPGVYNGWNSYLNAEELYYKLKLKHYWGAFNAQHDVAVRGYEMKQSTGGTKFGIQIDINYLTGDKLGGIPPMMKGKTYQNEALLDRSLDWMEKVKITNSPQHWKQQALTDKFLEGLILNTGNYIERKEKK
jgi:hypothetical protein